MTRPAAQGDEWYESEQPTRRGMVAEVQRIQRRTRVRPLPVFVLAAVVTAAISYKVATRPVIVEAEVVLALVEGQLANHIATGLPVDQLRAYVTQVLLPDNKLLALVEKYDLYPLRRKAGPEFALDGLRGQFNVEIWKNSFMYYDADDNAQRSARIGISVRDISADRALDLAHDLANVVMDTAAGLRQHRADQLTREVEAIRDATADELDKLAYDIGAKKTAIAEARRRGQNDLAGILRIDLAALESQQRDREGRLAKIAASSEQLAGDIAAAGLDMSLSIVDETRPERPTHSGLVLAMVIAVVGMGSLAGAALVLGAFDTRIHDPDDVVRLGLPVLGHVPGFAGDTVGSMRTRSAAAARVPSFQRWRFHR
jgi:hypothetical protein